MRKKCRLACVFALVLGITSVGGVATGNSGANVQPEEQSTSDMQGVYTNPGAEISGAQDIRLITPQMTYRERVEMQRALKKRAAARRNQLMQSAQLQKQQAAQAGSGQ